MGLLQQRNTQPVNLESVVLNSERLMLTPVSRTFAEKIFTEFTTDTAHDMMPEFSGHINDICTFIDTSIEKMRTGDQLVLAILDTETVQFSGICAIYGKEQGITAELGIWLEKNAQVKKTDHEAIALLTQWAKDNLVLSRLIYPVDKNNIPSRNSTEPLGDIMAPGHQQESVSGNHPAERIYPVDADA